MISMKYGINHRQEEKFLTSEEFFDEYENGGGEPNFHWETVRFGSSEEAEQWYQNQRSITEMNWEPNQTPATRAEYREKIKQLEAENATLLV